jgi:hypothetical protein
MLRLRKAGTRLARRQGRGPGAQLHVIGAVELPEDSKTIPDPLLSRAVAEVEHCELDRYSLASSSAERARWWPPLWAVNAFPTR